METEISLSQLIDLVMNNIVIIIVCTILGTVAAFGVTKFVIDEKYEATVKLYVYAPQTGTQSASQDMNALNYAQKVVNTYIQMLETNSFYTKVLEDTNLYYTKEELKSMITFSILSTTEVFQAKVLSNIPENSKIIADSIAKLAPETIFSFQENASLKIVDPALTPIEPSSPNVMLNVAIGFILGAGASFLFVLLRDLLDTTIKSEEDLLGTYDIPVLASIPDFQDATNTK